MKKFQLEPTNNIALINVILDKGLSLGYALYNSNVRKMFLNPKDWGCEQGQYISFGDSDYITRSDNKQTHLEVLSLEEFFKLTPHDCQEDQKIKFDDGRIVSINQDYVSIPYVIYWSAGPSQHEIILSKNDAIELANKILKVMQ